MQIQDNVIKSNLKNVIFVCGTACGGKTTMAKLIAEKYGFYLYDMDKTYPEHRAIADQNHQPEMCYHLKDFHEQWTRPTEEQARWNNGMLQEQTDMGLVDLMAISRNQKVVADVLYTPLLTKDILDYNQIVFLTVDTSVIRKLYFNRPEKRDFYEFVAKQKLADVYFENIFKGLETSNDQAQAKMKESGFLVHERTEKDTPEGLLALLEKHFKL